MISHNGNYDKYCVLRFDDVQSGKNGQNGYIYTLSMETVCSSKFETDNMALRLGRQKSALRSQTLERRI